MYLVHSWAFSDFQSLVYQLIEEQNGRRFPPVRLRHWLVDTTAHFEYL